MGWNPLDDISSVASNVASAATSVSTSIFGPKLDPGLGLKIPSVASAWDGIAHPNPHSVWGQLTGNWKFGTGGSDPQAPPPPPTQADANKFALNSQLSQEQKMYASRSILGSGSGLLDEQPSVASRVLLGS